MGFYQQLFFGNVSVKSNLLEALSRFKLKLKRIGLTRKEETNLGAVKPILPHLKYLLFELPQNELYICEQTVLVMQHELEMPLEAPTLEGVLCADCSLSCCHSEQFPGLYTC